MIKVKPYKKICSAVLVLITLLGTLTPPGTVSFAEALCHHQNGDKGACVEREYGFAQICPDCQGDYANFIRFEYNDFSEPKTVDLTPYNNNETYTAEIALVSISPTSDVTLKLSETVASDNNTYFICQTDYETFKDAFTGQDEEKMTYLESTIIFSAEGSDLPATVDLCAGQEYLLYDSNWNATANFGSLKLADVNYKGVIKTNDNWQYSTEGILKKYLGNDKNVVIPQSIDGTDICDVETDLFNDDEFDTIKIENLLIENLNFIASCKYVTEVYTHNSTHYSLDDEALEGKHGTFRTLCSEYAEPNSAIENCTKTFVGKCSVCGYEGYIDGKDNHDYSIFVERIASSATEEGYDLYKCKYCASTEKRNFVSITHNYKFVKTVKHTCIEDGYDLYICADCDDEKTIANGDVASHEYEFERYGYGEAGRPVEFYKCAVCGNYDYREHILKETIVKPTCDEYGYTLYSCENCDYSYRDNYDYNTIPHNYEIAFEQKEPTCLEDAYVLYQCSGCPLSYKKITQSALGHNYVITETVEPTCTKNGYNIYTCSRCGDSYEECLYSLDHIRKEEFVPPTYDTKGYTRYYCERCGETLKTNNYVPESKYDITGSTGSIKAEQNSAVVFTDGNYYYVMLWENGRDACEFSYSTNSDGTINFTIRSDTTCIIPDNNYANSNGTYKANMPIDNVSTAYLYKYVDGKWQRIQNEWSEDSRFGFRIDYGSYGKQYPRLYSISFNNIKAGSIEDIVLWYKDDYPYKDGMAYFDFNEGHIVFRTWEEWFDKNPAIRNCEDCNALINSYRASCFGKHLYIINQDTDTVYDFCNKNEQLNMEEQFKIFTELNNAQVSEDGSLIGHMHIDTDYLSRKYWEADAPLYSFDSTRSRLIHSKSITVNYVDINGSKLTDSDIIQSRIFDEYTTTPKEIEGYTLYALPANAIGITGEKTVVNYIYKIKESNHIDTKEENKTNTATTTKKPKSESLVTNEPDTSKPTHSPYTGADYSNNLFSEPKLISFLSFTGLILFLETIKYSSAKRKNKTK